MPIASIGPGNRRRSVNPGIKLSIADLLGKAAVVGALAAGALVIVACNDAIPPIVWQAMATPVRS